MAACILLLFVVRDTHNMKGMYMEEYTMDDYLKQAIELARAQASVRVMTCLLYTSDVYKRQRYDRR